MQRGALFVVWGTVHEALLERALASVKKHHPELPIHVHRAEPNSSDVHFGRHHPTNLAIKASMCDVSPFDTTLFLDVDTVVLGRLDYPFEKAEQFGIAARICEHPWARRYHKSIKGGVREFNTGVLFFSKTATPLFDRWKELTSLDSSSFFRQDDGNVITMVANDQCGFAAAVEELGINPFVLPTNYNFRPQWDRSWFGPILVWHDYQNPPDNLQELCNEQSRHEAVLREFKCKLV